MDYGRRTEARPRERRVRVRPSRSPNEILAGDQGQATPVTSQADLDEFLVAEEQPRGAANALGRLFARGPSSLLDLRDLGSHLHIFGSIASDFFSRANWLATSEYAVEYLLLALGQTFVIATGGIDLSDGAVLGFSAMVSAVLMQSLLNGHVSSVLATLIGCIVAWLSGQVVGRQRPPGHESAHDALHRDAGDAGDGDRCDLPRRKRQPGKCDPVTDHYSR